MPNRPPKKAPKTAAKLAPTSRAADDKLKQQRFAAAGPSTRIQGHVAAHGRRSQAKRDAR